MSTSQKTYTSLHNVNIICFLKTYLDLSTLSLDPILKVQVYDLIRANHLSIIKRRGFSIYYKNHFPMKLININLLQVCFTIECNIKNKLSVLITICRSPRQSQNKFFSFITNLKSSLQAMILRKPFLVMVR